LADNLIPITDRPGLPWINGSPDDPIFVWLPCIMLKITGTKNKVATVAKTSPPITARPNGAFC
jgi:hypothetical protein